MELSTFAIMAIGIACIIAQRAWYTAKMHRLGAQLIGEAYKVRDEYPSEYPAYREEAVYEMHRHGLDDLIDSLPT